MNTRAKFWDKVFNEISGVSRSNSNTMYFNRMSSSRSRIHGKKCIFVLRPLRPFLLSISKCLFKFYGPYLSQLSMMFSGLWPRNIPYWSEGREFSHLRATRNKDKFGDLQEGEFMTLARALSRFVWLTLKKRRRSMQRRRDLSFTRFSKRESADVNMICEPEAAASLLTVAFRLSCSFPLGCVRAIQKSTFIRSRFSSVTRIWKLTKITKLYIHK